MTNKTFKTNYGAFYVKNTKTLDFFMQTDNTIHTNKQVADARAVIFSGLFLCLFDCYIKGHTILMLIIAETVRDSVRARAPLLGSGSSFGFFYFQKAENTKSSRRRDMRNAQKTVPTTVGSMALAPVVPQKAGVKAARNRVPAPKSVTTELKRTNKRCGWEWEDQKAAFLSDYLLTWASGNRRIGDKRGVKIAVYDEFFTVLLKILLKSNVFFFEMYGEKGEDIEHSYLDRVIDAVLESIKELEHAGITE